MEGSAKHRDLMLRTGAELVCCTATLFLACVSPQEMLLEAEPRDEYGRQDLGSMPWAWRGVAHYAFVSAPVSAAQYWAVCL